MIWLSPRQLAELSEVSNMPIRRTGIRLMAERQGWQSRDRIGKGGGKEYLVPERYLTDEFIAEVELKFPERLRNEASVSIAPTQKSVFIEIAPDTEVMKFIKFHADINGLTVSNSATQIINKLVKKRLEGYC